MPASQLEKPQFVPVPFPEYELPVIFSTEGRAGTPSRVQETVSLAGALQRSPFLLIVLLGEYRANGPYMQLMRMWVRWAEAFRELGLVECHVITAADNVGVEQPARVANWLNSERKALSAESAGLTAVLHDPEGSVERAVQVHFEVESSPFCVLVRGGTVVMHSGQHEFDDVALYELLTATGEQQR